MKQATETHWLMVRLLCLMEPLFGHCVWFTYATPAQREALRMLEEETEPWFLAQARYRVMADARQCYKAPLDTYQRLILTRHDKAIVGMVHDLLTHHNFKGVNNAEYINVMLWLSANTADKPTSQYAAEYRQRCAELRETYRAGYEAGKRAGNLPE